MHSLARLSKLFNEILASTTPMDQVLDVNVTRKGNEPAQTLKKLVLGRLISSSDFVNLARFKGDSYHCEIGGGRYSFRFAVTASPNSIPWFNISISELENLAISRTMLLVLWNSKEPDLWCRSIRSFSLDPDAILDSYRSSEGIILKSLIISALRKLERDSSAVPGLRDQIKAAIPDIDHLAETKPRLDELHRIKHEFLAILEQYAGTIPEYLHSDNQKDAKHVSSKLREKLGNMLLRIHPNSLADKEDLIYVLRHEISDKDLLVINGENTVALPLGDNESLLLFRAYGDGVEEEQESRTADSIGHPYDPAKTKIDTRPITIDLLTRRISHDEIDLTPAFQRKAGLWSKKQKSQLIESLLIRIPLPSFYFDATDDSRWLVVDGLQRLVAFKDFILGEMALEGMEYLNQYNHKMFSELPRPLRRSIEESQVTIHLIQPGTPPEVKFNIFRRVNTGGLVLTPQEIRHALNQGPIVEFLATLATSTQFLEATTWSIPTDRMADREFVLRFLAFNSTPYSEYKISDMDAFLSREMGKLNRQVPSYEQYQMKFVQAMNFAREIFGRHAFRKLYNEAQWRSPINKALFEAWSVHLGNLSKASGELLVSHKSEIVARSIALNSDPEFSKAISQATADTANVLKRFSSVEHLIKNFLEEIKHA